MKGIIKVIISLEIKGILLKGTTARITSQEWGFLSFLRPLMSAGLPLMKSALALLTKSVLLPLGLTAGMVSKLFKTWVSGVTTLIVLNKEMKDIIKKI